jgi:hypothetical protein
LKLPSKTKAFQNLPYFLPRLIIRLCWRTKSGFEWARLFLRFGQVFPGDRGIDSTAPALDHILWLSIPFSYLWPVPAVVAFIRYRKQGFWFLLRLSLAVFWPHILRCGIPPYAYIAMKRGQFGLRGTRRPSPTTYSLRQTDPATLSSSVKARRVGEPQRSTS